jgi:hypothetical protein
VQQKRASLWSDNWHPWRAFGVSVTFWSLLLLSFILRLWRPQVTTLPLLVG